MGPKTLELKALCASLGRKYVGFRGNPQAPLWFIGEAPGADEDQAGIPFVGASGRELDKMLREAGIPPELCCFTNSYKVRPPENDIERIEECGISRQNFIESFFEELEEFRPPFVIPLGGTPLGIVCPFTADRRDKEFKISKWRGSLLTGEQVSWPHYVIPNLHPAYILREWSDRDVSIFIFRRVKEEYDYFVANGKHQPLPERQLLAEPSFNEAKEYLINCIEQDGPVSVDIELLARRVPITIAFSNDPKHAISIELFSGDPKEFSVVWRLINLILKHKWVVGQNYTTFDANWLEAMGFSVNINTVDDTLVQHHVLYPEMSHKLDFLGMQFTRQPYWKDDGKSWNLREGMSKLKRYNALDASVTLEVFLRQTEELIESHGGGIGINEFLSKPTLAAGFGVERQTQTATRLSLVEVILHHMYSESSTNFSSTISNQEKNCIIDAKTKDASILGMESLSLTENIPLDTEDRKHIALKDTNSLQR